MADHDPRIDLDVATPIPVGTKLGQKLRKYALMLLVPALLAGGAWYYYKINENFVSTDNAYVQQDKVSVSAEVTGRITHVGVHENQHVNAGDLLFRIDGEPFRIAMAQADASIAAAQVNVVGLQTIYATSGVDIDNAQEDVRFFETEYRRQAELMRNGFTTKARLDTAQHALSGARSKLANAQADATKARAALASGAAAPGVNPQVLAGQVQKRKAVFDLSKTEVRAPVSGVVTQADRLQPGQMITQSLPVVTVVASERSWIEANFKETDLDKMRIGQPAEITFDAYPDLKLNGKVSSIGAGTGSEFSVLPAQNANGNWVKVTQRVPVRIAIQGTPPRQLIAGLSTHVRVDTSK